MAEKAVLDLYDSDEDTTSSEEDDNTIDDPTPSPRFWHFSQLVKGNVYVGGGNIPQYKKKKARARLLRTIEEFSVKDRKWRQRETTGDHHPGLTGVACASFGKYLFAYGGNNLKDLNGVLSQLDLDTFVWSQLSPETANGPMKKDASGMVHFGENGLAVMCGYAIPRNRTKPNGGSSDNYSRIIKREGPSADGGGWTNEMHIFNYKSKDDDHPGMWTPFSFEGPRPPPCADFSLTSVDLYKAILYGGHRGADENNNDFYVIDFSEKKITRIKESKEDKWPKMRFGHHAACCLDFNTKNPQLLISGGRIKHELPPKDIWILNLATQKWKQVELPIDDYIKNQLARWGHTFTAITHSEGLIEIILFGGSPGYFEVTWDVYKRKDFKRLSFPASFVLGFLNKEWVILDVLDCSIHWTSKTTGSAIPFDLNSPIVLDVLHSMERDEIPILTKLVTNKMIRSIICSEHEEGIYKWPTFTKPSFLKPIWENLISILKLAEQDDLVKMIEQYLKKMEEIVISAEEEKHIATVQKAMEERGMLDHTIVHGVFVGPARSGKNSLMERLLGRMPSSVSPSTGAAEGVVQVKVIQKSTTYYATNVKDPESVWSVMDYDDEAIKLMLLNSESKDIVQIPIQEDINNVANSGASLSETRNTNLDINENKVANEDKIAVKIGSESDSEWLEADSSLSDIQPAAQFSSTQLPDSYVPPLDILKDALRRKGKPGLEILRQHFQKTWSLYLTNTGGQIEFQEVLPLLVSGPSIFFFTFRLDRDITQRYVIEYEVSGGDKAEPYTSTLSIVESLLQTLSTVAAMGTFVYKGLQRTKTALRPKFFIIGTHKDQLESKTADEYVAKVDEQLQKAIKETSHYDNLIEFASSTRLIFAVNNFSESDEEFKIIRLAVERVVVRNGFQMTSPAHWLIFSLALRKLKPYVVSYEQCLEIAKQCGLKDNEVTEALHFIHSKMGVIRYFHYDDIKDLVVTHPQFLFDKVTDLIVDTFTFEKVGIPKMTKFKQNGIFSLSEFEAASSRSSTDIQPFPFAKLLERLRIAAPFQVDGERMYFFPCVLAHALEDEYQQLMLTGTSIPQLIVTFKCGYCPKGLAGALIKYLMANEMESCYTWEISTDKIFRNQVSFHVGPLDTIVLRITPTYLEIVCIPENFPNRDKECPLTEVCTEVRKAVEAGIKQITCDINYVNAQHGLTFLCECKGDHPGKLELLPNGEPYCLSCRKTGKIYDLPPGYELWQIHKIDNADSEITHSVEKQSHSENSIDGAGGGATSDIPLNIPVLQQQFRPLQPRTGTGTPSGSLVCSPYPQFTNRGLPTGHNVFMTPYGYHDQPVLMPTQQGISSQPYATMAPLFIPFGGYPAVSQDISSASETSLNESGRLTPYHLGGLLSQLSQHATKWRDIGTYLGFVPGELSNIGASPSLWQGAPVSWLSAMLAQWLQRTSSATLEDLKTALGKAGLAAAAHDLKL